MASISTVSLLPLSPTNTAQDSFHELIEIKKTETASTTRNSSQPGLTKLEERINFIYSQWLNLERQ